MPTFTLMRGKLLALLIIAIGTYCVFNWEYINEPSYLHDFQVPEENVYIFDKLSGPTEKSIVPERVRTSWKKYDTNNPSAFVIFLTDTSSGWIGLVHGLKNIGVPVTVTTDIEKALKHRTIFVYPLISGKVLTKENLQQLAAVPRNGGNLIGVNVYGGGLNEVFGFDTIFANNSYNQLLIPKPSATAFTKEFTEFEERNIILTNPVDFPDEMPTNGYTNARTPLIVYTQDTNAAFLTYKDYGVGKAFAFGLDLGNYFLRYMNERGFNAYRAYANQYAPGMDVILRILKKIYTNSENEVTIGTVPFNKDLSLILSHDIDFTKSIVNTAEYARMEDSMGVKATYFIQVKYVKDWNDDIFFKKSSIKYLKTIKQLGMEIGSHSISHSRVFSKFPLGTGKEYYPRYKPFVKDKLQTHNASILGELRVSKFLLDSLINDVDVVSFRPGHLQYPFALPEALVGAGYKYSSSVTANNVQTHLPYMLMYNRGFDAEVDIVEIPVTVEDELGAPLMQRLDSTIALANLLSKYGGMMNVLIHTDTLGEKYEFEKQLIAALKDNAWIGTIRDLGYWWRIRNQIQVNVKNKGDIAVVTVMNPSQLTINGLTLHIPKSWTIEKELNNCKIQEGSVVIKELKSDMTLQFKKTDKY